jgi:L,D-transpeptidase YcbB
MFKFTTLLSILLAILIVSGCKKKETNSNSNLPDSTFNAAENYSGLALDSTDLQTFFKNNPVSDSLKSEVQEFYNRRNLQYAWFNQYGVTCAISTFYARLQNYRHDFEDNSLNSRQLDSLLTLLNTDEKSFISEEKQAKQLELLLTTSFFKYAEKVYGGTTKSSSNLEWFIPRKKKNYQILLDTLVSSLKCEKLQEPVNQYYIRLKEKLSKYRAIEKKGGFQLIITKKKQLLVGESDSCLVNVKQHLFLTNDLAINDKTFIFTDELSNGLKLFQRRMGLTENGKIDKATLLELNKPVDFRIRQIMLNLERLRWIPVEMEKEYLLVNIPEFKLHIYENNKEVWATNVVVGQTARRTSIFKGNMSQIILNPYWGVPTSIGNTEILAHLKKNPNYLAQNNMEVFSGDKEVNPDDINWNQYTNSVPYNFRQKPGEDNALGKMKFMFPNNYHIYLHDTPSKHLFESTNRAFSHGCIRVENPLKLANYLLRNNPEWNPDKVNETLQTDEQIGIRLKPTVPVYIAYFTAWVDVNGQMNFRKDLYHLDEQLSKEVFGK